MTAQHPYRPLAGNDGGRVFASGSAPSAEQLLDFFDVLLPDRFDERRHRFSGLRRWGLERVTGCALMPPSTAKKITMQEDHLDAARHRHADAKP